MNESKCCADSPDTDVYVDVTSSDPVYESIQLQPLDNIDESTATCIAAEKLIEKPMNEACSTDESDGDKVENVYTTFPDQ